MEKTIVFINEYCCIGCSVELYYLSIVYIKIVLLSILNVINRISTNFIWSKKILVVKNDHLVEMCKKIIDQLFSFVKFEPVKRERGSAFMLVVS